MNGKVLVAGIGNTSRGDDAFGPEAASRLLSSRSLPQDVEVVNFGMRRHDLAFAMMKDWDLVILLDSLPNGGHAGTLYVMEAEFPANGDVPARLSTDSITPSAVLGLVRDMGGRLGRVLLVGCEPASTEPDEHGNVALSAQVQAAVHEAVRIVQDLVTRERMEAKAA